MADRPSPPSGALDTTKTYTAQFKTEKGDIVVELYADRAPLTVENFVNLARAGFYDGTNFHRVIQRLHGPGRRPDRHRHGGPGYQFGESSTPRCATTAPACSRWPTPAPARTAASSSSPIGATPHLDDRHTVFGRVTEGMDVVHSLRERDRQFDKNPGDRIDTIEITES